MNTENEWMEKTNEIKWFRYSIISELLNPHLPRGELNFLIQEKAEQKYDIPFSKKRSITEGCIRNWIYSYRKFGKEGLLPKKREDKGKCRTLTSKETEVLINYLKTHPEMSVIAVLRKLQRGGEITSSITSSALSRLAISAGLDKKSRQKGKKQVSTITEQQDLYNWRLWVLKVIQGEIAYPDLANELKNNLYEKEIYTLADWVVNKPLKYRNKAMTILSFLHGIPEKVIVKNLFISPQSVKYFIERFKSGGIDKLIAKRRRTVKKAEDPKYKDGIFAILHAPPSCYGINRTTWCMKDIYNIMAEKGLKISKGNIHDIIRNAGYRIRKAKKVLTSTDPAYREKLSKIKQILSKLGTKEKFFSIDEFGPIAIKIRGGRSLVKIGEIKAVPQNQKSKGSLIVTAALELSTNQITHFYSTKKNTEEMIKLLEILLKNYADEDCIYFSWDAASWHASKKFYTKVEEVNSQKFRGKYRSPWVKLAPLPSSAQFLNVIESVFSGMAKAIIHNSDYNSVEECKSAIDRYFVERNQHFRENPKRAGNKIWGDEIVKPQFSESNNCKDPHW